MTYARSISAIFPDLLASDPVHVVASLRALNLAAERCGTLLAITVGITRRWLTLSEAQDLLHWLTGAESAKRTLEILAIVATTYPPKEYFPRWAA